MRVISCTLAFLTLSACGGSQTQQSEPAAPTQSTTTTPGMGGYETETHEPAEPPPAQAPEPAAESSEQMSEGASAAPSPTSTGVRIEQSLASYCNLALPNAFFDYDSAQLRDRGSEVLGKLSTCLNSEALRGRSIEIVGHADPRGSDQYNQKLGRSRAESVAEYLSAQGVSRDRIQVRSMGEQLASERPKDYQIERRVDIRLAPSGARDPGQTNDPSDSGQSR